MSQRGGQKTGIYRSKLEQSWAMFFVQYGIPFINEPRYYDNWLPDFELTACRALIEIKPTPPIAEREVSRYYRGMSYAFRSEKRDIVLLVGFPMFPTGYLENIMGFADSTLGDDWGSFDKNFIVRGTELVQCKKCEAYFFIGNMGGWQCRKCGYYAGSQGFNRHCLDWEPWKRLNPWVKKWFDTDWNKPEKAIKSPAGLAFYLANQEMGQGE